MDQIGATPATFRTQRAHAQPFPVADTAFHPLFFANQRKHFDDKLSPSYEFKPCRKPVAETKHEGDKLTGTRKIVAEGVIYKPKIERLTITKGCKPEDLKEFVGPREFLQRYKGVNQKIALKNLEQKRE